MVETGAATPEELRAMIAKVQSRIDSLLDEAARRPKLSTAQQVVAPLAPYDEAACLALAGVTAPTEARRKLFDNSLPENATAPTKRTMAAHINAALADEMLRRPEIIAFGEDIGKKGGVYYVTQGLQKKFGVLRCFDTLLDETTILGVAQGAAMAGLLPIPEIQYLAYLHNALDQIRGEACSLSFFSSGQFTNPMVVRIAGLAYQKGFGGHFHNDNSLAVFRDIPGVILAVPSNGRDAVAMLRECVRLADDEQRVVVFVEPIALYMTRDLHAEGDGLWTSVYQPPGGGEIRLGEIGLAGDGTGLAIVSYANGYFLSLQAHKLLAEQGVAARVIDLRWLAPLPVD
ncbi:MAG: alpha-ketoacid dehydrogenase subunit beta, partial [Burkholderiales bacterium]